MHKSFFNEFDEISAKQWKQKIQFELEGSPYQDLIFNSLDGIDIKPFYTKEDYKSDIELNTSTRNSLICDQIYVVSEEKSNQHAQEIIADGAESIWFIISSESINLELLFNELPSELPIFLKFEFLSEKISLSLEKLKNRFKNIHLQIDNIGHLARYGNWHTSLQNDFSVLKKLLENSANFNTCLAVDSTLYQNAGATIPQQLAYTLAHANEYFNFIDQNLSKDQAKSIQIQVLIASGSNFFFEIAKIKTLRRLFSSLATIYNFKKEIVILAQPSKRNKTLYASNFNLLRCATENMSAIIGGCDAIYNIPFDSIYRKSNKTSKQIARKQLQLLKANLNDAKNASNGAYYIENITEQLAEKSLRIFTSIEKSGGFLVQLKAGSIQKKIQESAAIEQTKFDNKELTILGGNVAIPNNESLKNDIQLYPFLKKNPRKTLLAPILERRLSEKLEQNRLQKEKL
ncbi:methylmalonyl-CoA mutase family protein [Zunongwangia sp.]|uniref:methylmalonyl-CoA mutase family protein n=1 Tax=Zunongwangia sp. TaxID=1965325 RepID=UPI003AA89A59